MNESDKASVQIDASMRGAMLACAGKTLAAAAALFVIILLASAWPTIASHVAVVWGSTLGALWRKAVTWLTNGGTDILPVVLIAWGSMLAGAWAFCLVRQVTRPEPGIVFVSIFVAIGFLAALPAACTLFGMQIDVLCAAYGPYATVVRYLAVVGLWGAGCVAAIATAAAVASIVILLILLTATVSADLGTEN